MDQFFPTSDRVIYEKSPLVTVVCQVRYPTILRIESQPPADFQDAVRNEFPIFERGQAQVQGLPRELAQMIGAATKQQANYRFKSLDGKVTISLSPDALSVTSESYGRWESFERVVRMSLEALERIHKPSFLGRTGLRYQNALRPAILGLNEHSWPQLLSQNIVGELSHRGFTSGQIVEAHRHLRVVDASSKQGFLLQHGLGELNDTAAYIVDIDCYSDDQIEVSDAYALLAKFNQRARHAFRWCISDQAHLAMEPRPVSSMEP